MCEGAGACGGMAGAEPMVVLWPQTLCSSQQRAPLLSGSPLWGRREVAVEPPHRAPGDSPAQSELRGHRGPWGHVPPPRVLAHTR